MVSGQQVINDPGTFGYARTGGNMAEIDFVRVCKALSDKTRQDILELLGSEEKNVTDICSEFNISQPTVSHHLQILRQSELVDYRKEGKSIYYCLKQEMLQDLVGTFKRKLNIDNV